MKKYIIEKILKPLRRWCLAIRDSILPTKKSYSQYGEDDFIINLLKNNSKDRFYIDIGSNHPTVISNSYLFYRNGWSGVIVEPNPCFKNLYKVFRSRDKYLQMGIGEAGVLPFLFAECTVLSGFHESVSSVKTSNLWLPILPLDSLFSIIENRHVSLLSIDVEGMDFEVLKTGEKILDIVEIVVIETGEFKHEISDFMLMKGFSCVRDHKENMIFRKN